MPVLAASNMPTKVTEMPNGAVHFTFHIRDEATWDNGEPITAKDVEFALKVSLNRHIDNGNHRGYYDFITDFIFDPNDPKTCTIVSGEPYMLAEAAAGEAPEPQGPDEAMDALANELAAANI